MAASKALQRVVRIRGLQEEQQRAALEAALAELHQLEAAVAECTVRERHNRRMLEQAAVLNNCADRQSALVELDAARRRNRVLHTRLLAMQNAAELLRAAFLEKRVERRQAETLVAEADARERAVQGRRAQQTLDDGHNDRKRTLPTGSVPGGSASRQNPGKDEGIITG